jgi:adenylate cyclase
MERLDFTVVGPAVNEVARIAALCRSVDQPILMSSAFAASADKDRRRFASVGRFPLHGVGEPQELFYARYGWLRARSEAAVRPM